jgi:hypothetical protein
MNNSYIEHGELTALQLSTLPRDMPFMITGVSHGQFSIARHSGGISYNGRHYTYIPATDELVRDDVVKWLKKKRKENKPAEMEQFGLPK